MVTFLDKTFHNCRRTLSVPVHVGCVRRGRLKNKTGYLNLAKLSSRGYLEGFYYTPRIDKELLVEHSEGLIASSACLGGEIPQAIMKLHSVAGVF